MMDVKDKMWAASWTEVSNRKQKNRFKRNRLIHFGHKDLDNLGDKQEVFDRRLKAWVKSSKEEPNLAIFSL
jgi:hypothetical protein